MKAWVAIAVAAALLAASCDTAPETDERVAVASYRTWPSAKNTTADYVYFDMDRTFYCGCAYTSDNDDDGSGFINADPDCGYRAAASHRDRAGRIEWEHVVPASLMPARNFQCWADGGRDYCIRNDLRARAMLLDLHNLAPAIGQVNALRLNDRYADLPTGTSDFGACEVEDGTGYFEPPDCTKGDAARTWLYMEAAHGVVIPATERSMFLQWAAADPVSPWESVREQRIAAVTGTRNPYVAGVTPDPDGACWWEVR